MQKLAAAAPGKAVREAILLAAMSGLRKGELLALKAADRVDGALSLGETKSGRPRIVPIPPEACEIRLPIKLTVDELRVGFDIARAKAKLPHVRFHDLRRTYGTWLSNGNYIHKSLDGIEGLKYIGTVKKTRARRWKIT